MSLPKHLHKNIPKLANIRQIRSLIEDSSIHTVCEEAKCPNIGECFAAKTCTFMILGKSCTRQCAFCGVTSGHPLPIDPDEPKKIAAAIEKLNLKYVVITSVTRDDLPDGGAEQFSAVVKALHKQKRELLVEVLIPDFQGRLESLTTVLEAHPYVLNHNIETVARLYPLVRPQAHYDRSLELLKKAKQASKIVYTKSGFMVGLGEEKVEVAKVLRDLKNVGCDLVTIGQYLPPTKNHLPATRYVDPEEFEDYRQIGLALGLRGVLSGPFVRSSYHAAYLIGK